MGALKYLVLLFFLLEIAENGISQTIIEKKKPNFHVYRQMDLYPFNTYSKIYVNDSIKLKTIKGRYYETNIGNGCYELKIHRGNSIKKNCFDGQEHYYKVVYKHVFIFGYYDFIEVTKDFYLQDIQRRKIKEDDDALKIKLKKTGLFESEKFLTD